MRKDQEPTGLSEGVAATSGNSSSVDYRPQRTHGTGRTLPNYDLLSRNEGPGITDSQPVDASALLAEINTLSRLRPTAKKYRGRGSFYY